MTSALEWLYFLLTKDGRSKYEDPVSGAVAETASPTPLVKSPGGWEDLSHAWERDKKRLGMAEKVTLPFKFFADGAKIVRDTLYRLGTEAELYLAITRRFVDFPDTSTYDDYHKLWWRAQLDLSSCVDEEHHITVKFSERGLARKLKAFENQKFEFSLNDPEAINVLHDGTNLRQTSHFLITKTDSATAKTYRNHLIGAGLTVTDGEAAGFAGFQVFDQPEPTDLTTSIEYLFRTYQDINSMRLSGTLFASLERNVYVAPVTWKMWLKSSLGLVHELLTHTFSSPTGPVEDIPNALSFDYTFNAREGEKFFLVGEIVGVTTQTVKMLYKETRFDVNFSSRYRATTVRCYQPHILLDKIIEKISGKRNKSVSALLSSLKYRDLVLTSGDGMRGLDDPKIKISFNEFFNIYQVYTFAGCAIEKDQLVMEVIDRFFDASDPIDISDKVASVKFSIATDLQGNSVKIGHKQKDADEVNGKYSFNNTFTWNIKAKESVEGELKYVTEAIADPYTIEALRLKYGDRETTDSEMDNDLIVLATEPDQDLSFTASMQFILLVIGVFKVYIIKINDPSKRNLFTVGQVFTITGTTSNNNTFTVGAVQFDPNFPDHFALYVKEAVVDETAPQATVVNKWNKLLRVSYDEVTGIPEDPTIYNIELLSPKRLLMLWERWFNSVFYRLDGQVMAYGTTERNADLKTVLGSVTIEEKADFPIGKTLMWKPFWIDIKTYEPIDPELVALMEENPNRCFAFVFEGVQYKGFYWRVGCAPDDNRPQVYRLLMTPDTKETYLIR